MFSRIDKTVAALVAAFLVLLTPLIQESRQVGASEPTEYDRTPDLELVAACTNDDTLTVAVHDSNGAPLLPGLTLTVETLDDEISRAAAASGQNSRIEVPDVPNGSFKYAVRDGSGEIVANGSEDASCDDGWGGVSYALRLHSAVVLNRVDKALLGYFLDSDGNLRQSGDFVRVVVHLDQRLLQPDEPGGDIDGALDDFYESLGGGVRAINRSDEIFAATMEIDSSAFALLANNDVIVRLGIADGVELVVPEFDAVIADEATLDGSLLTGLDETRTRYPGSGIGVAVVDTGIDYRNPDLAGSMGSQKCASTCRSTRDQNGHGTRVAGLIASSGDTSGVVGGAPAVDLHSIKVAGATGLIDIDDVFQVFATLHTAPEFAREPAGGSTTVRVVNLSFGSTELFAPGCGQLDATQSVISASIENLSARGFVFVAAAGNDGEPDLLSFPACLPHVVGVSASQLATSRPSLDGMERWEETNGSPTTTVMAPGVELASTSMTSVVSVSGTSFAAPLVSACVASIAEANPQVGLDQVQEILASSVGDRGSLDCSVAVSQAVERRSQEEPTQTVTISGPSCSGDTGQVTFTITNHDAYAHRYFFKAAPPHGWDVQVGPGETAQYTLGGIPLGRQAVYVARDLDYQIVEDFGEIVFDCGREWAEIGAPSCPDGNGALTFHLRNDTDEPHRYFFKAGPPHGADVYLEPEQAATYHLRGIRPGDQEVWVALDDDTTIVHRFPDQEFCGVTATDPDYSIADVGCVGGVGNVTFTIHNSDQVAHRYFYKAAPPHGWDVIVAPGQTVSRTLSGVPSGHHSVWVARDDDTNIVRTFPDQKFCS